MKRMNVRQKPVVYEASFYSEELPEDEARTLADWAGGTFNTSTFHILIPSIGGWIAALPGVHWILRHPNGAVSVCPKYSFGNLFDIVAQDETELAACDCDDIDEHDERCGADAL